MSATLESAHSALAAVLAEAAALSGVDVSGLAAIRAKFAAHAFNLVVAGEFKRGKSTLINALLGAEVLPTGVVPLTSVVTTLRHDEAAKATVEFENGDIREVGLEGLAEYVTEHGNPDNRKRVREAHVAYPATWLKGGIRLVDTPGVGSVHEHNSAVTTRYLPEADAVIFMASADQPLGRAELDFLVEIRRYAGKVFCLLNKLDQLTLAEREESLTFATGVLRDAIGATVPVFGVSARMALRARLDIDAQRWNDSGVAAFDRVLRQFLREEGGDVWIESMRRQLWRWLAERRLSLELERQARTLPLAQLETNLTAFARKKQETLQARSDLDALVEAEARKLRLQQIEPDLYAFFQTLRPQLQGQIAHWYDELRGAGAAVLQTGLEARSIEVVRAAFDTWRTQENQIANQAFECLCQRFWQNMRDTVDELLRYSAELFAVPFTAVAADAFWHDSSGFYYKFWDEPSTLQLLGGTLVRLLPGALGHPVILRRARRRADDLLSMQCGRVRSDFESRLAASAQDFRRAVHARMEATITGIEAAIDAGRTIRQRGQSEAVARSAALDRQLVAVRALEARLAHM